MNLLRPILLAVAVLCAVPATAWSQASFEVVRMLLGGTEPTRVRRLIRASDGDFYALTLRGGAFDNGAVVRISPSGAFTVLHPFTDVEGRPIEFGDWDPFFQASDGSIYGMTWKAVFRITLAGEFSLLQQSRPSAFVDGRDGYLYGVTSYGGNAGCNGNGCGTFFRMTPAGVTTVLLQFPSDLTSPSAIRGADALIRGADGDFYGTSNGKLFRLTPTGALAVVAVAGMTLKLQAADGSFYGTTDYGRILRVTPDGWVTLVHDFQHSSYEPTTLVQGIDGNFYGTRYGYDSDTGRDDCGFVFRMTAGGDVTVLHGFTGTPDGGFPVAFFEGTDGTLYGATQQGGMFGAGSIFKLERGGRTFSFVKSLSFGAEGSSPYTLVNGDDGNLYGTTFWGGEFNQGTIFKMTPGGALTVLQAFSPQAGLTKGPNGTFYGAEAWPGGFGLGRIFQMTASGALTVIHDFKQEYWEGPDNAWLTGPLVLAGDGNLYGTNQKALFRVTPAGELTAVAEGSFASIVLGSDGSLYVAGNDSNYRPAIFRVSIDGAVTLLHSFNAGTDGTYPYRFMQSYDGNFYGVTNYGGPFGAGTVFRLSPDGAFAVLYAFGSMSGDEGSAAGGLVEASDGNFYGVTATYDYKREVSGAVYRITRQGTLTVLHRFDAHNSQEGGNPYTSLTETPDGNLYGVTSNGGVRSSAGVIYRLNFHRAPPAAPTLVRAAPTTNAGVRVTWSRPLGAISYAIKRAVGDGTYTLLTSNLSDATFVDTTVTAGEHYHYIVTAFNEIGESVGSYDVSTTAGRTTRGDFDGDGQTDLVWRHTSGDVTIWLMRDFSVIGGGRVANVDPAWTIAGLGDYNGDGRSDLLWRHNAGDLTLWLMDGTRVIGGGAIASVDPSWQIVTSKDFDGDGRDDIAWRESTSGALTIWLMNGKQIIGGGNVATVDAAWTLAATGDFNGDGRADALWQHSTSQDLTMWLMDGTRVIGGGAMGAVDPAWQIAAAADHNGDGRADILWRRSTGDVTIWLMNGTQVVGGGSTRPFDIVDPVWQIAAAGDYGADGRADILWRDGSGTVSVWFMNGEQAVGGAEINKVDPSWQLVNAP